MDEKLTKLVNYYEKAQLNSEFGDKLYGLFKSLTVSCLNLPEITPILLGMTLSCNNKKLTFSDFMVESLESCLPMFCEFYMAVIKSNCGFIETSEGFIPMSLRTEFEIKLKLLSLLDAQISTGANHYAYLPAAFTFVQEYSENNRLGLYRCMRTTQSHTERLTRQFDKFFNGRIIALCQQSINAPTLTPKMGCK